MKCKTFSNTTFSNFSLNSSFYFIVGDHLRSTSSWKKMLELGLREFFEIDDPLAAKIWSWYVF
jgi:hypothetical protein